MLNSGFAERKEFSFLAQVEPVAASRVAPKTDLWFYRSRTVGLLRRYARVSISIGRLPSLLGSEPTRTRVSSNSNRQFEDLVIFVADMDRALEQLSQPDRTLLAIGVVEDYTAGEVARILRWPLRSVERQLHAAIDNLSQVMLRRGMLGEGISCQEGGDAEMG